MTALVVAVAVFAACLPLCSGGSGERKVPTELALGRIAIPLLTLLLAALVGMEFPLAARVDFQVPPRPRPGSTRPTTSAPAWAPCWSARY